jgi:hypothetical protein
MSEETKAKISAANKGRVRTPEARKKHSETRKRLFKEGKLAIPWKGKKSPTIQKTGKDSPFWKGGRYVDKNGYVWLRDYEHPNRTKDNRIMEHRLVMSNHLGRPLWSWESVHHRNAMRQDNRIENLQLVLTGRHQGQVICPHCSKEFAIR